MYAIAPDRPGSGSMKRIPYAVFVAVCCLFAQSAAAFQAVPDVDGLVVRRSSRTGRATMIAPQVTLSQATPRSNQTPADPMAFFAQYGASFGLMDAQTQLTLQSVKQDALGHTMTEFRQVHQGVPVYSGVLKYHTDASGVFSAANGRAYPIPPTLDTTPTISVATGRQLAQAAMDGGALEVVSSELMIVDPGWYGDPPMGPHLAYYIVLHDAASLADEAMFIDAHKGRMLDRWSMVCTAMDRSVHDHNSQPGGVLPGPPARGEGDPATGVADVDAAYDYMLDTYDYYWRAFGRDSYDDAGSTIVATVNTLALPCPNAAWIFSKEQMIFCPDVVSDDMIGHELTHGVTQTTANLIYQNQPGQLNESYSDIFGELIDLFNGDAAFAGTPSGPPFWPTHVTGPGTDTPNTLRSFCSSAPTFTNGYRWLFAEDATGYVEPLRDMWNPTCLGDPETANSVYQTCSLTDNGGVHSGSGVLNHAFVIATDGKNFNGYNVSGIGPIKTGAVWYRTLTTYLTIASDFEDAYWATNQAAQDLIGTFPNDPRTGLPSSSMFTAADAAEIDKALLAVELNTPGACGGSVDVLNADPPTQCAGKTIIFADDFESGVNGWTVSNTAPPTPYDWVQTSGDLPFDHSGTVWFIADPILGQCHGNSLETGEDVCAEMDFLIGEGTYRFNTTAATQDGPADCSDGGDPNIDHDVWFCWTATCDGVVTIETCDLTSVDTKIAVYDGCDCPPTTLLACNDDACGDQSSVSFSAVYNGQYLIRIGTPPGAAGGEGHFLISTSPVCSEEAVHSLFSPVIAMPAELSTPTMAFTHYVETEPRYDGGNIKISVNGSPWELLPTAAYRYNAYNRFLFLPKDIDNPLAGQVSFTGVGGQWGTTIVDLGPLVSGGDTLQVRFDFGKDACFGFTGWFVDDFAVYDCSSSGDCNHNGAPDEVDLADGPFVEEIERQMPNVSSGNLSDDDPHPSLGRNVLADDFLLPRARRVDAFKVWGAYTGNTPIAVDDFTVEVLVDDNGLPGSIVAMEQGVASTRTLTGRTFLNISEYEYDLTLSVPVSLAPGRYWVSIYNNTVGSTTTWVWERAITGWIPGMAFTAPGCVPWCSDDERNFALIVYGGVVGEDCNANEVPDECEINAASEAPGGPFYCTANCDLDCNGNGSPDDCDFIRGDADLSGQLTIDDVAPFVDILLNQAGAADALCACDINRDGSLDGRDISDFVTCILNEGCL